MVSKIMKKTPRKPTKDLKKRRRKASPLKKTPNATSVVLDLLHTSITSCHRHILKIIHKLTTPNRRKHGYQLLHKTKAPSPIAKSLIFNPTLLPPPLFPKKKTIFLDLDETLIHSQPDPPPQSFDFVVRPTIGDETLNFYVSKRPKVEKLLEALSEKYELVVFTAGLREYASLILDEIDRKGLISYRLFRDSCKEFEGKFVKDLREVGRDLKKVVLVDDNPNAYVFQPENAFSISPFVGDLNDRELDKVIEFFAEVEGVEDVRDALKRRSVLQAEKKLGSF